MEQLGAMLMELAITDMLSAFLSSLHTPPAKSTAGVLFAFFVLVSVGSPPHQTITTYVYQFDSRQHCEIELANYLLVTTYVHVGDTLVCEPL